MRPILIAGLVFGPLLGPTLTARADDVAQVVSQQKQTAEAIGKALQLTSLAQADSANFLLFGTVPPAKLKSLATTLEKEYTLGVKVLQFEKDEKPWTGKLAVYVFTDRGQLRSFIRHVQKRSPDDAEQGCHDVSGEAPYVAAGPGRGKDAAPPETQAGYELGAALLAARAKKVPLPEWLVVGFGRATAAQAAGQPAPVRKRTARDLVRRLRPSDVWNDKAPYEQRMALAPSVADYLFYGKGLAKPGEFLSAFQSDDENPTKTPADALKAVKLTVPQFEAGYLRWLRANN